MVHVKALTSFEYEVDTEVEQQRVVDSKPHPLPKYLYKRTELITPMSNSLNSYCTPHILHVRGSYFCVEVLSLLRGLVEMGVCHSAPCTDVLLQQPVAERRHCREQLMTAMEMEG